MIIHVGQHMEYITVKASSHNISPSCMDIVLMLCWKNKKRGFLVKIPTRFFEMWARGYKGRDEMVWKNFQHIKSIINDIELLNNTVSSLHFKLCYYRYSQKHPR